MLVAALAGASLVAAPAGAALVQVMITGEVEYNQVSFGAFGNVNAGDAATLTFLLDSDSFVDSGSFPTRGYVIDQSSFSLTLGSVTVGLQSPFPAGQTPYFVLRNNDPAVDGFFISTNVDFPFGVPLDEPGGISDFFEQDFSVTYGGGTLSSLDILDATGTYDFTGLTNFNWTIDDGPFNPIGMVFGEMTITVIPAPAALALLGLAPWAAHPRRRRR